MRQFSLELFNIFANCELVCDSLALDYFLLTVSSYATVLALDYL